MLEVFKTECVSDNGGPSVLTVDSLCLLLLLFLHKEQSYSELLRKIGRKGVQGVFYDDLY